MSDWSKATYSNCKPNNIPSFKQLYDNEPLIVDGWVQSKHLWCGGCYHAYKLICKRVSEEFNIPYNEGLHIWSENDLINMVNKIYNETKSEHYITWLNNNESKLESIIDCINSRYFQHKHCYNKITTNRISTVSNRGHMRNLTTMCSGLLKLYILYEKKLKEYNDNSTIKKKNLLLELNKECANNCRNALRGIKVTKILDDLNLKKKDVDKLETTSRRSKKNSKRSRRKGSYNLKNNKMVKLINKIRT